MLAALVCYQVQKFGHPNGIVGFDQEAQVSRDYDEPEPGTSTMIQLPVFRIEGTIGTIRVCIMLLDHPNVAINTAVILSLLVITLNKGHLQFVAKNLCNFYI